MTAIPPPVRLHVLYAGRGDGMVVERNPGAANRRVVIVDGGPRAFSHGSHRVLPYFLYLKRVLQDIYGPGAAIEPDAFVLSVRSRLRRCM
jgi:hypothetical protein